MDILSVPLEDIGKIAGAGGGGLGFMALMARFLNGNIRGVESRQKKVNEDMLARIESYRDKLSTHELSDANNLVKREELQDLREHIDNSFRDQRDFFLKLVRGGPGQ